MSDRPADSVDPKLLEILVCPLTKTPLEYDAQKQELISRAAKLAYPIRDGIPSVNLVRGTHVFQDGGSLRRGWPDQVRP